MTYHGVHVTFILGHFLWRKRIKTGM